MMKSNTQEEKLETWLLSNDERMKKLANCLIDIILEDKKNGNLRFAKQKVNLISRKIKLNQNGN